MTFEEKWRKASAAPSDALPEAVKATLSTGYEEPPAIAAALKPVPMLLWCPLCHVKHVDEGEFETRPHHTHACQNQKCGLVWRPALVATVGVDCLPGFKNGPPK